MTAFARWSCLCAFAEKGWLFSAFQTTALVTIQTVATVSVPRASSREPQRFVAYGPTLDAAFDLLIGQLSKAGLADP